MSRAGGVASQPWKAQKLEHETPALRNLRMCVSDPDATMQAQQEEFALDAIVTKLRQTCESKDKVQEFTSALTD